MIVVQKILDGSLVTKKNVYSLPPDAFLDALRMSFIQVLGPALCLNAPNVPKLDCIYL